MFHVKQFSRLLVIAALASFVAAPALAQQPKPKPADALGVPGGIIGKSTAATVTLTGDPQKDAKAIWSNIKASSADDLNYAIAMATAAGTPASKTRLQCLTAILAAKVQAEGSTLMGPDGKTPLTRPDPSAISNIESVAELIDNLSPQGPLFTSCAGAAQLTKANVLQLITGIVTGVASFGATGGLVP